MKRRELLQAVGALAGATALGGVLVGRAAYARTRLASQLVADASTILVAKEHSEIASLPSQAAEEMKLWFTAACLNSAQFVDYICSERFATRLGEFGTPQEKQLCVETEFLARVVSQSAIHQRIDLVATETGAVLDRNWSTCCDQIADKWKLPLRPKSDDFGKGLHDRLDAAISAELKQVIARSANLAERTNLSSTTKGIGREAILVLPLVQLGPQVFVAAFASVALLHFAQYVLGWLAQDASSAKAAISDQLALLGNRVAAEFNSELKTRIADLHAWQNRALRDTATEYAHDAIGLL